MKRGLEDKITFENLWMLFDAGASIYCPFHEGGVLYGGHIPPRPGQRDMDNIHMTKARHVPQIFRVLGTTGGLPLQGAFSLRGSIRNKGHGTVNGNAFSKAVLRNLTAATEPQIERNDPSTTANLVEELLRGTTLETFSRLNVVVFHIDFNGIEYGIAEEIFTFKAYDGVMDIRNLQAYPTQFLPKPTPLGTENKSEDDRYLVRGNKFIDLTFVSHWSFDGLTAGKGRQEINSAVIVDFQLGFQEYSDHFAEGESVVPRISTSQRGFRGLPYPVTSPVPEVMQLYGSRCREPCCRSTTCVTEGYMGRTYIEQERMSHRKIKDQLEEHVPSKLQKSENMDRFRSYMEKNDFIRLLPGTVLAFALRN